jgi:hypothetical protein
LPQVTQSTRSHRGKTPFQGLSVTDPPFNGARLHSEVADWLGPVVGDQCLCVTLESLRRGEEPAVVSKLEHGGLGSNHLLSSWGAQFVFHLGPELHPSPHYTAGLPTTCLSLFNSPRQPAPSTGPGVGKPPVNVGSVQSCGGRHGLSSGSDSRGSQRLKAAAFLLPSSL